VNVNVLPWPSSLSSQIRPLLGTRDTFALLEGLEDALSIGLGDPDPGVGHRDRHVRARRASVHPDGSAGWGELDRVGQQVEQYLAQAELVGPHRRHVVVDESLEDQAATVSALPDQTSRSLDESRDIERRGLQDHLARLDLRQVEDVVEQSQQVLA
jgi:hypothetical protein